MGTERQRLAQIYSYPPSLEAGKRQTAEAGYFMSSSSCTKLTNHSFWHNQVYTANSNTMQITKEERASKESTQHKSPGRLHNIHHIKIMCTKEEVRK